MHYASFLPLYHATVLYKSTPDMSDRTIRLHLAYASRSLRLCYTPDHNSPFTPAILLTVSSRLVADETPLAGVGSQSVQAHLTLMFASSA